MMRCSRFKISEKSSNGSESFLTFSVIIVSLGMISSGAAFIWTSPMLSILKSNTTDNPLGYPVSPYEESLLAGLISFGGMLGTFFIGMLADIYGRKKMLLCFSMLDLISTIVLATSSNIYYYCITRFLQGISFGFAVTILPLYVGEICEDHNRGKFGSFVGMFFILGNLYGYSIGPFFNLTTYTLVCAIPLMINIIGFILFIPESPVYLATKGDRSNAKHVLQKLYSLDYQSADKALEVIELILNTTTDSSKGLRQLLEVPGLKKTLIVSIVVNMLQQASGICAVLGFMGPIFDAAAFKLSGNTSAILVEIIQVISVVFSSMLIEKLGRRLLLLVSTSLGFVSLVVLGLYFYMKFANPGSMEEVFWLPFVCLVVFMVGYGLGLGPVPMVFTSEIFSNDFKSAAASLSHFCSGAMAAIAVASFPIIADLLGMWWCFWVFGLVCGFGVVFVYVWVPETKGKNLIEIQELFK